MHQSGQQVLVDIPHRDKKARDLNASGIIESKGLIKKSRQNGPEEAYIGKKEMILSGGSHDRGAGSSNKTVDTMSALSDVKLGPIAI